MKQKVHVQQIIIQTYKKKLKKIKEIYKKTQKILKVKISQKIILMKQIKE